MKQNIPSKKDLMAEVRHWRFEASALSGQTKPWLQIPGLIVFLDTTEEASTFSVQGRIAVLEMALAGLKRRMISDEAPASVPVMSSTKSSDAAMRGDGTGGLER